MKKARIRNLIIFVICFIVELLIAVFVHDQWIRPYVGDILVVVLIYYFIRIFLPKGIRLLPLYVFLFAAAVEISQYFGLVDMLGPGQYTVIRIILGSTFDLVDLICYGVGCLLLGFMELRRRV